MLGSRKTINIDIIFSVCKSTLFTTKCKGILFMQRYDSNCDYDKYGHTPRNYISTFYKEHRFTALFGLIYGAILYSLMMTQQLTNTFDGLWKQNYHYAGAGELSSGRWLLEFVDKLVNGTHADPVISVAALSLFVVGFVFVLDLFKVKNKLGAFLCLAIFISSTLISNTLSYRFTSLGYGLAYFLAALSIYVLIKARNGGIAVCVAGIFLGLSMSCYQAYVAVFPIVAVFYAIFQCKDTELFTAGSTFKRIVHQLLRVVCSLAIGALFYSTSLFLRLKWCGVTLSNYNGIGQISGGSLITNLPQNILKAYQYFYAYFFMDKLKINCLQSYGIFCALIVLLIGMVVYIAIKTWKTDKKQIVFLLLIVAAIPVASNAYMLIASDKLELQMTAGLAMLAPLTMIVSFSCLKKYIPQTFCAILCVALLYGNSMQVWMDQEAMYEGQNACDTMMTQVVSDLRSENLLSSDYEYFFVGVPEENPLFSVSNTYYRANAYAQMGRFWVSGNCCQASYEGLIDRRLGFNLPISYLLYENVADKLDVFAMPEFPL